MQVNTVSKPSIPTGGVTGLVSFRTVMGELGYTDEQAFKKMAERTGLPLIRVTRNCVMCDVNALRNWLETRSSAGKAGA